MSAVAQPVAPALTKKRRRRVPKLRRVLQVGHRWGSIFTGILLLVVVLSGVALVLDPEIDTWVHPNLYQSTKTGDAPLTAAQAVDALQLARPDLTADNVVWNRGHWEVYYDGGLKQAHIDPGTGHINGYGNHYAGVMGFVKNLHECALSCAGEPGYLKFMAHKTPLLGNPDLTVAGIVIVVAGLILVLLCLSGIVLWWPGIKRMAKGMRIRRGKGRYAFQYDLHKVVGMAAIPFLLMWALTGAGFEIKQVEDAFFAVVPGKKPPEYAGGVSTPPKTKAKTLPSKVSITQAEQIAQKTLPGYKVRTVSVPDPTDKTSAYSLWMEHGGVDPTRYSQFPGTAEVVVDRYSGTAKVNYAGPDRQFTQKVWQDWQFYGHAGYFLPGVPRVLWIILGLTPLLLAITGLTTWLIRRRKKRAKKQARKARLAAA